MTQQNFSELLADRSDDYLQGVRFALGAVGGRHPVESKWSALATAVESELDRREMHAEALA